MPAGLGRAQNSALISSAFLEVDARMSKKQIVFHRICEFPYEDDTAGTKHVHQGRTMYKAASLLPLH